MRFAGIILLAIGLGCSNPNCDVDISNNGIGGNSTNELIKRLDDELASESPNMVILLVGTNDMVNTSKQVSYEQYSSNLDKIIYSILDKKIDLVLVSPPPVDTLFLYERHDKRKYLDLPNNRLLRASKILEKKAIEHDLTFVDLFSVLDSLGIPDHNLDALIANETNSGYRDGVHPTAKGNEFIANIIVKKLIEDDKIEKGLRISCFGDSITEGVRIHGEGSAEGKTYPSLLKLQICNFLAKADF